MKFSTITLSLLFVLLLGGTAISQTAPKMVFWSEEPGCGKKNASVVSEDIFKCSLLMEDQWKHRRIEHNGLIITVKLISWGRYFIAQTHISNQNDQDKTFDIKDWSVVYFTDQEAFNSGAKPIGTAYSMKKPPVVVPLDAVRAAQNSAQMDQLMGSLDKTVEVRDTTRVTTNPNTTTGMKTSQIVTASPTQSSTAVLPKTPDELRVLKEKSVPAKKEVYGRVYFPLESDSDFRFASILIDGVYYLFPAPRTKK